jgi:hypothetical protein
MAVFYTCAFPALNCAQSSALPKASAMLQVKFRREFTNRLLGMNNPRC